MTILKTCSACKLELPVGEFRNRRSRCRDCQREHTRVLHRQRHPSVCGDCNESIARRAERCAACRTKRRPAPPTGKSHVNSNGYVVLKGFHDHPNSRKSGHILEHVKIMSDMIGRPLVPGENVHHKNGVRKDNRPENLELWFVGQPKGQRAEDLVVRAKEILARYEQPGAPDLA